MKNKLKALAAITSLSSPFFFMSTTNAVDSVAHAAMECLNYNGWANSEFVGGAFGGQPGVTAHPNDYHAVVLHKTDAPCTLSNNTWHCSWRSWTLANDPVWEMSSSSWFTDNSQQYEMNWSGGYITAAVSAASMGYYFSQYTGQIYNNSWVYGEGHCFA